MSGTFCCPDRVDGAVVDEWRPSAIGGIECSFCRGLKPSTVIQFVSDGTVLHGTSDTRYLGGVRKVNMKHFTEDEKAAIGG